MTYEEWFIGHSARHADVLRRLSNMGDDEIIEYFDFENMRKNEPDFCPLYAANQKCHETEKLNCYLCACPNFRFDDNGFEKKGEKTVFSFCSIASKDGGIFETDNAIHQNCSGCLVPHSTAYVKKHFSRNWLKCMEKVRN